MTPSRLLLITGGSTGLGKALVEASIDDGWTVVELSRSGHSALPSLLHVACDLSDIEQSAIILDDLCRELAGSSWAAIRVIHNAGQLGPIGTLEQASSAEAHQHMLVNLFGLVSLSQAALRHFQVLPIAKTLVTVSSGAASQPYAGWSLYCSSKAGGDMLMRSLKEDQSHQPSPFRCVAIRPGVVDTGMQELIRATSSDDFPQQHKFVDLYQQGQLLRPEIAAQSMLGILAKVESAADSEVVIDIRDHLNT